MSDLIVWRCARCGNLNEDEATILWDDDNQRWFKIGDKCGQIEPLCHRGCVANIYTHPELMSQMYRLEPIETP